MGLRASRLGSLTVFLLSCAIAATVIAGNAETASAARIRVTRVSAAPSSVSRYVLPKRVTLRYRLSKSGYVTAGVYSSSGRLVKRLAYKKYQASGSKRLYWSLKTSRRTWARSGRYYLKIHVKSRSGHKATPYPAKVSVVLDNVRPKISLTSLSPSAIVPARGENTLITYRLSDNRATRLTATLDMVNSSGVLVRRITKTHVLQGTGRIFVWDGRTAAGAVVPVGRYLVRLRVKDAAGNGGVSASTVASWVDVNPDIVPDTTPPSGVIISVSPASVAPLLGQKVTIAYSLSDNIPTVLNATVDLVDASGVVVRSMTQAGVAQGISTFEWDGRTSTGVVVPAGWYWARLRIVDAAGNVAVSVFSATAQVHISVGVAPDTVWSRDRLLDIEPYYTFIARAHTEGDFTHVVWNDEDGNDDRIRYRRLDKYGNTVVAPVVIGAATLSVNEARGIPDVSADASGGAYVVWRGIGRSSSYRGIWIARIDPDGTVAWAKMVLSESSLASKIKDPRVAVTQNGLAHVVCVRGGYPSAILYASFRPDRNDYVGWASLATGSVKKSGEREYPNIEADDLGRVHVAWYDSADHSDSVSKREIYYTRLAFDEYGHVLPSLPTQTIDRSRLTSTTAGYSQVYPDDAPAIAVDGDGAAHIAWPDKVGTQQSNGISYLKVANNGSIAVTPRRVLDGSVSAVATPYQGHYPAIVALPGGGARIVTQAQYGSSGPRRLWQVDVSPAGAAQVPFTITTGAWEDLYPSLGTDSNGGIHLVYAADTNVSVGGSHQQRLTYKDTVGDAAANDVARCDLEVDYAHIAAASTPSPPRQNTPVVVNVEVRNAGWVPVLGGTATLEFEGVQVATAQVPALSAEATAVVPLSWAVPNDATRTPAALAVRVVPIAGAAQTAVTNDAVGVPLSFDIPPTSADLLVDAYDETYDEGRWCAYPLGDATVRLVGTTLGGAPLDMTGTVSQGWNQFLDVPLGTYTMTHNKAGCLVSAPVTETVTIAANPSDPYELVVTPNDVLTVWFNRWGSIAGIAHESDGTTPVVGAEITVLETGATTTTPVGGMYRFGKISEGTYRIKAKKTGYKRTYLDATVLPAQELALDVPMSQTTTGYAVGTIVDEAGYPAINDPEDATDDPTLAIRTSPGGALVSTLHPHDGTFNVELAAGNYTFDYSAPGFIPVNGHAVSIVAGEETPATMDLLLDVSEMTHMSAPERWVAPWTISANWFGNQPPGSEIPSYDIKKWNGLFRFTLNGDRQKVGLNDYLRYVNLKIVGEMWEWHYLFGVDPPVAPGVFQYGQDLFGLTGNTFEPPRLAQGTTWNRTGVRVDGIDILDERSWEVVSSIRSQWNSCAEQNGHLYGFVTGGAEGDGPFPAYTHAVPYDAQVVRIWLNVGRMDADGTYYNDSFAVSEFFNRGQLMQGGGYNKLALYWRPDGNGLWVEPALVGYP